MFVLLGVRDTDGVDLTEDGMFRAKYGYFSVETPLDNIDHTEITGPHRWYTAVGPRLSFADDGLTFGTNHTSGLCVAFKKPIRKVIGLKNHSALWVSVASPERLRADWKRPSFERFGPQDRDFEAAMAAHDAASQAGDDGYLDPATGLFVMTATTLAARPCCGNQCRHCPWQH